MVAVIGRLAAQVDFGADLQQRIALPDEQGPHPEVAHGDLRTGREVDLAVDAGHAPVVRILQIAAVAPLEDLHRQAIVALANQVRDVELRRQGAVLEVADRTIVQEDGARRVDAAEVEHDALALPRTRHLEPPHVATRGIVAPDCGGRIGKRIIDVGIDRIAVSAHLPARGYVNRIPVGHVAVRPHEIVRRGRSILREAEAPLPVERAEARPRAVARERILRRGKGIGGGPRREPPRGIDARILPRSGGLRPGRGGAQKRREEHSKVSSHIQSGLSHTKMRNKSRIS